MATRTASVTGDWGTSATWGGAGVPGDGDTATINSGVTVSVTDARIIGTSPAAGNTVLTTNQTSSTTWGTLAIKSGGSLKLRGDFLCNGVVQVEGGGILEFDASLAASPSSQNYKITLSNGGNPGVARFVTANTSANNRAIIRSNAGGGNGCITSSNFRGYVDVSYVDFIRCGTTSLPAVAINGNGNASAQKFYLVGCTFDGCLAPIVQTYSLDLPYNLQDCTFANSLLNGSSYAFDQTFPAGSANRTMINNRFDKIIRLSPAGLSASYNVFAGGYTTLTPFTAVSWQYNLNLLPGGQGPNGPDVIDKCYTADVSLETNPHSYQPAASLSPVVTNVIWDHLAGTNGDLIVGGATGRTYTATGNIVLPNSSGGSPGELVSPIGTVDAGSLTANHNTVTATALPGGNSESGLAVYGETFTGVAGMYASLQSNLIYSPTGKGSVLLRHNQSLVADPIQSSGGNLLADYNGFNAPITAIGSGVQAVYGASGGYCDTNGTVSVVRVVGGSTGSFTLLCYHSNGVTTAETAKIAYNAAGATVASAVQTALNTLSDGTYAVSATFGGTANSASGSGLTITRNASAISQARIYTILRPGGTNTTLGTVYTTREMFSDTTGLGVHDIVANPNFVDTTRNLATFDTAYLSNTAADGTWTNGASYTVGQIVSTASSNFYNNATINFRCIANHTATSGNSTLGQPGVASSWITSWEFASVYRLRASAPTYSAGVRQATARDLYEWVKAGWAPTNATLRNAGHDSVTIGAVEGVWTSGLFQSGGGFSCLNFIEC